MNLVKMTGVTAGVVLAIGGSVASAAPQLQLVAGGLSFPVAATAPDGDARVFVLEQTGKIRVVKNGAVLPTPFLDIGGNLQFGGEQGALGLTFAPDYATTGVFYVDYIEKTTRKTVVGRYRAAPGADVASPTEQRVLEFAGNPNTNHKGGWIGFRPGEPSNLYVATGDSGGGDDPQRAAQNLDSYWGKILRLNVGATAGTGPSGVGSTTGYAIPAGNPRVGKPGLDEIWSYGLRNPFRNSFDRANGDFWIGDVGQNAREEIDVERAGTPNPDAFNYGWVAREGSADNTNVNDPTPPGALDPYYDYTHADAGRSIIGGYVYRAGTVPELYGKYVFGDYVSGRIFTLPSNSANPYAGGQRVELTGTLNAGSLIGTSQLSSFGEDGAGGLLLTDLGNGVNGQVFRVVPEPSSMAVLAIAPALLLRRRRQS